MDGTNRNAEGGGRGEKADHTPGRALQDPQGVRHGLLQAGLADSMPDGGQGAVHCGEEGREEPVHLWERPSTALGSLNSLNPGLLAQGPDEKLGQAGLDTLIG